MSNPKILADLRKILPDRAGATTLFGSQQVQGRRLGAGPGDQTFGGRIWVESATQDEQDLPVSAFHALLLVSEVERD